MTAADRRRWWRLLVWLGALVVGSTSTTSAQTGGFAAVATIAGPADLVAIHDGRAYVTHHTTLTVHDLADPSRPEAIGTLSLPEEIWGFRIAGDRIYLGANFTGLVIADISDPAEPRIVGTYKSLGQTKIGAVYDTKVALIDHMEGFVLVDATTESTPAPAGSFFLDGYARDVVTAGPIAFATDSPTGLYVFDLSREGAPEPIAVLHAPSAPRVSLGVTTLSGGTQLLAGVGGGNLQLFDVSDPTNPVKTANFDTPGTANGVSLVDDLAYVADGEAGLQVFDLTDPSSPRPTIAFATDRPARAVAAADDLVLVVTGDSEREGDDRNVVVLTQPR